MINIPMNSKPPLDLMGGASAPPQPMPQQGMPQQGFGQVPPQQDFAQQQGFGQPQPQQGCGQQQQGFTQPQQGFAQPQQATVPRPSGGGVSLVKGQKVSLTKINPNLDEIFVGLGWDTNPNSPVQYDLDAEAFLVNAQDRIVGDEWFVFYNQPISPDASVRHEGDNRTGQGSGDDEVIHVKLSQVSPQVDKIVFVITINDARQRGHTFGGVSNAYIRVVDQQTQQEMVRFNLTEYYKEVTSMMVGELYKKGGEWRFSPIGAGKGMDLLELCQFYGVNVN